ncbi:hypothetical protein BJ138DRAFT_1109298 [Hygrophoropsis aurantiaca]|uniref:Uncharacterized protein n=1 Tax=Hygrophoropsis aurantiaca TaxID=72124 RepID=A0ACB8ARW7_9AGAM|nr:hypothetical protein BJ138DRAFT_1109298 [Hygrophoropsis aurantiaca]
MPNSGASAIFKAGHASVKAVITLVLIENSQEMVPAWPDLRDRYLPILLGTMRLANPLVPIPVLWLTSTRVGDDKVSTETPRPRQFNQLPELQFCYDHDNKISPHSISHAIELISEASAPFQGQPISRHLIIVSASSPIEGSRGVDATVTNRTQVGQSSWHLLGQQLAQHNIHCHMILSASRDMGPLRELFLTSLQRHRPIEPWFPTDSSKHIFYLCAESEDLLPPFPLAEKALSAQPPVVQRRQTFPQDVPRTPTDPTVPLQPASEPSLVSSLQKMHGLSRKKLYGAQPSRQPFVRDESVRTKYRQAPTPLSIPPSPTSSRAGVSPTDDGRVTAKSKFERGRRSEKLSRTNVGSEHPQNSGRRSPWSRSRVSSPDLNSLPSSPTSVSSHVATSPTMSVHIEPGPAGMNPVVSGISDATMFSPVFSDVHYSSMSPGMLADSSVLLQRSPIPEPSPTSSLFSVMPQDPAWAAGGPVTTAMTHNNTIGISASPRAPNEVQHTYNMSSMSGKYRLDSMPQNGHDSSPKVVSRFKDDGDAPFIFSPEYEAETAAKLRALQSSATLSQLPAFTSMNKYTIDPYITDPHSTSNHAIPQAYTTASQANVPGNEVPNTSFSFGASSSLQGWAG